MSEKHCAHSSASSFLRLKSGSMELSCASRGSLPILHDTVPYTAYFRTFEVISSRDEGLCSYAGGILRGVGIVGERVYVGRACALTFAVSALRRILTVSRCVARTFYGTGLVLNMPGPRSRPVHPGCASANSCATSTRDGENTGRGVVVSS